MLAALTSKVSSAQGYAPFCVEIEHVTFDHFLTWLLLGVCLDATKDIPWWPQIQHSKSVAAPPWSRRRRRWKSISLSTISATFKMLLQPSSFHGVMPQYGFAENFESTWNRRRASISMQISALFQLLRYLQYMFEHTVRLGCFKMKLCRTTSIWVEILPWRIFHPAAELMFRTSGVLCFIFILYWYNDQARRISQICIYHSHSMFKVLKLEYSQERNLPQANLQLQMIWHLEKLRSSSISFHRSSWSPSYLFILIVALLYDILIIERYPLQWSNLPSTASRLQCN